MDRIAAWWAVAFGEFRGITAVFALLLLLISAIGFGYITPNQKIIALDARVTVLEGKQIDGVAKLDALIRISCLNNLDNARLAGVKCEDYFGNKK